MADRISLPTLLSVGAVLALMPALFVLPARAEEKDEVPSTQSSEVDATPRINKIESIVKELELSDEQKAKVKEEFSALREKLAKLTKDKGVPREEFTKAMNELRDHVTGVLSEEQKQKLHAMLQKAGFKQPVNGQGPLAKLRERLSKVGLSEEQRTKIEGIVEEHEKKIREAVANAKGDTAALAEKVKPELEAMKKKVADVLTPDQASKFEKEPAQTKSSD